MPTWDENLEENKAAVVRDWENRDRQTFVMDEPLSRMRSVFKTSKLADNPEDLLRMTRQLHVKLLLCIPASVIGGILIHAGIIAAGFWNCVEGAAILAVVTIAFCFLRGTPVPVKQAIYGLNAIVLLYLILFFLDNRTVAAALLMTATLVLFACRGKRLLDFYHEWIFAGFAVDPEIWEASKKKLALHPSFLTLAVLLSVAVVVPALHSVTFAILLELLLCIGFIALSLASGGRPFSNLRTAVTVLRNIELLYMAYPDTEAGELWRYSESLKSRRRNYGILWGTLAIMIAISLSYCIPFELFASWFQRGFFWPIPPAKQQHAFAWLVMPFTMIFTAGRRYAWAFVIGAVLSYILPYLILFTVYLPNLLRVAHLAETVEKMKDDHPDLRTLFQWYVDRLRGSFRATETPEKLEI